MLSSLSLTRAAAVYTISYNANGGSGVPSSQTKDGGINLILSRTVPTRTGYTFAGWNTAANGTNYAIGATFTGSANFSAGGGSASPLTPQSVDFSGTYAIPAALSVERFRELVKDYYSNFNGSLFLDDDLTSDKKVTPSSLKAHLKQLLKKGNLHVGYLTTE